MTRLPDSSTPASTPNSSPSSRVSIHQPNLFPRLGTIVKLALAETVVILDDVQYTDRDWQNRARIADLADPSRQQWLTVAVHRPNGRATMIRDVLIADRAKARDRISRMVVHYFRRSPHWRCVEEIRDQVCDTISARSDLASVSSASTVAFLGTFGWTGRIAHSHQLDASTERNQRLIDLTEACAGTEYLCGTGGMRYIDSGTFAAAGISVVPVQVVENEHPAAIQPRKLSVLWHLARFGPEALADLIGTVAQRL